MNSGLSGLGGTGLKSAAIFPGQGSEYPGMFSCISKTEAAGEIFNRIRRISGRDIPAAVMDSTDDRLKDPLVSQLAVFGTSIYYWGRLKGREDFRSVAGHSLGFYAALHASGSLSLEDCVRLIITVQQGIEKISAGRPGRMASIMGLRTERVEEICLSAGGVHVSNINSATQTVISGWKPAMEKACSMALEDGALAVTELPIHYPLHSPLMDGIEGLIRPFVESLAIREPEISLISHLNCRPLDACGISETLAMQLSKKVRWKETVSAIRKYEINRFVEVGPSDVLSRLVRWIERDAVSSRAEELIACLA